MPETPIARKPAQMLTIRRQEEIDQRQRPLDFRLSARLWEFTKPYASKRNWLLVMVLIRSVQLPALTWVLAYVINGPIQDSDVHGVYWGAAGFAALAVSTQIVMHFRQRLALELGESVVFDVRNRMFAHIQQMPMSWYNRTKVGRVISRLGSDVEDVRIGVQEVRPGECRQCPRIGPTACIPRP
jgi:ATP-binding cassette subfamily B protein